MDKPKKNTLRKSVRVPKVRAVLPKVPKRFRKPTLQQQTEEAFSSVPRITNETVAEHREIVLRGARKYKYPLQHSKHRIVVVSTALLVIGILGFFIFSVLSLYKFQTSSLFMYRVTQVIPFPVAKAGKSWVSYESYLFELRRYMHYYETQQQVDFESESGKYQLETYRPKALQQVIDDAYVKQLAAKQGVRVSGHEIDDAVATLRTQNQLGSNNEQLAAVTKKFFGWSIEDLRRQLKQELLAQKVAAKLDTAAYAKAQNALVQLRGGADFAALAGQLSDDPATKANGGQYNDQAITVSSKEVPPQVVRQLSTMQVGQISDIITTPTSFEIVKLLSVDGGKYKAAHIQIHFNDVQTYLAPAEKQTPPKRFIGVQEQPQP